MIMIMFVNFRTKFKNTNSQYLYDIFDFHMTE